MKKIYLLLLLLITCLFAACQQEPKLEIVNQEDLDKKLPNPYIKVFFSTENLSLKPCQDLNFDFDQVEVIKLSSSDFEKIRQGLTDLKLNPKQEIMDADLGLELEGRKYCVNHLGQLYRNGRKLQDNADLVYLIKSKASYFNYFDEVDLMKQDTLVARNGLPSNYTRHKPEQNGTLLENDSLVIERKNEIIKRNIIFTY